MALVHVVLAGSADEGIKAIQACGQVAIWTCAEVAGNSANVATGGLGIVGNAVVASIVKIG